MLQRLPAGGLGATGQGRKAPVHPCVNAIAPAWAWTGSNSKLVGKAWTRCALTLTQLYQLYLVRVTWLRTACMGATRLHSTPEYTAAHEAFSGGRLCGRRQVGSPLRMLCVDLLLPAPICVNNCCQQGGSLQSQQFGTPLTKQYQLLQASLAYGVYRI